MQQGFLVPKVLKIDDYQGVIENVENMLDNSEQVCSVSVSAGEVSPVITLDFGKKVTGYLFMELTASSGDTILVEYGPVKSCIHVKKRVKMPPCGSLWVDSRYIACRYMKISLVSDSQQPQATYVNIKRIGLVFSAYPCAWKGKFESENPMLNKIWQMGAYTVQLCMQRNIETSENKIHELPDFLKNFINTWKGKYSPYVIFDGPRRDREAWLGDIRTEALVIHTAFGAYDVVKSSLEIFLDLQKNDGVTYGCAGTWQNFIEYNFWWIISIWECYLYSGDKEFLGHLYPGVRRLLDYIVFNMDDRGFIYNDGNWMWTLPREGYSSGAECILYYALICGSKIEKEMYNEGDAEKLSCLAEKVKGNINKEFWDEEKGVYIDDLKLLDIDIPVLTDVNCYAILFGIADSEKSRRILKYLKDNMWTPYGSATLDKRIEKAKIKPGLMNYPLGNYASLYNDPENAIVKLMYPHNRQVWPFINGYETEARMVVGDVENAFELIERCWGNTAYEETGTFWEMFDIDACEFAPRSIFENNKSDCLNSAAHGWSGWISYIMQTYILGVRPARPGFKKTTISPVLGNLKNVSGCVPTPYGVIKVAIKADDQTVAVNVQHPEEIEVEITICPEVLKGRNMAVNVVQV